MVAISVNQSELAELCRKWRVQDLGVFGSAVRADFKQDSDIDLLATYMSGANPSLFDHMRFDQELANLFGRRVDLISRRGLNRSRNNARRKAILDSVETIYAAR